MEKSEALRIIREYYPSSGKDLNEALETLIPELKESEDERIRSSLIRLLQVGGYMSPEDKDKAFAWLAKQGKQKWTEEDETYFSDAMWCVEQARKLAKDENDMGNCWATENWLKSLKSRVQPQWKPSEEQMEALDEYIYML